MRASHLFPILLTLLLVAAALGVGGLVYLGQAPPAPSGAAPPPADSRPTAGAARFAEVEPMGNAYLGHGFPGDFVTPTSSDPQSKLWYFDDHWWGLLLNADRIWTLHRLNWQTQEWEDSGIFVDERQDTNSDVLWNGDHLYIVTGGTDVTNAADAPRLLRFSPVDAGLVLDPGFPVELNATGALSITLAEDSVGRLWIAFIGTGGVHVAWSAVGNDRTWSEPMPLALEGADIGPEEAVGIAAFDEQVGVMWSNQQTDAFYFASRADTDTPDQWLPSERIFEGPSSADNHLNLKVAPDGRLLAVVKTGLSELEPRQPGAPGVLLLARATDATWSQHMVGRVKDGLTRPNLVIDMANRHVHVFAGSAAGGTIYRKTARLEDLEFGEGVGTAVLAMEGHPATSTPTTSKHPVDATTGLVVLASDTDTQHYLHVSAALGGAAPGAGSPAPAFARRETVTLFDDRFDTAQVGGPPGNGWALSDLGSFVAVAEGAESAGAAALAVAGEAPEARACKSVPATGTGQLTVELSVRIDEDLGSSVEVTSIRGFGRELVSLRLSPGGTATYFDGEERITVAGVHQPGTWYRSRATVDFATQTYSWDLSVLGADAPVLTLPSAEWLPTDSVEVDKVCLEVSDESLATLHFDDVHISHSPG